MNDHVVEIMGRKTLQYICISKQMFNSLGEWLTSSYVMLWRNRLIFGRI